MTYPEAFFFNAGIAALIFSTLLNVQNVIAFQTDDRDDDSFVDGALGRGVLGIIGGLVWGFLVFCVQEGGGTVLAIIAMFIAALVAVPVVATLVGGDYYDRTQERKKLEAEKANDPYVKQAQRELDNITLGG